MKLVMTGSFRHCVLLTYRTPAEAVAPLVPAGLRLITKGEWAFWNVVACTIVRMRPAGFPEALGISYSQAAYRLYVEAQTRESGRLRGLYFTRSDADSRLITVPGNRLSAFRFHYAPVRIEDEEGGRVRAAVGGSCPGTVSLERVDEFTLPEGSCFSTIEEAREFLRYVPLGLAPDRTGRLLRFAEVLRDESAWTEDPAVVTGQEWSYFLTGAGAAGPVYPELATLAPTIPYRWRLGRTETLLL